MELGLLLHRILVGYVSLCFLYGFGNVFSGGCSMWSFFCGGGVVRLSVFPGCSGLVLELLRFAIAQSFSPVIARHFSDRILVGDSGMLRSSLFSNNLSSFVFLACGQLRFKWVTWCVSGQQVSDFGYSFVSSGGFSVSDMSSL